VPEFCRYAAVPVRRHLFSTLLAAALWAGVPHAVGAQPSTSTVTVTVRDQSGGAVLGVQLVMAGAGLERTAMVDAAGIATFQAVPPGRYDIEATRTGFTPASLRGIVVAAGEPLALVVTLRVPGVSAEVTVTGAAGYVEGAAVTAAKMRLDVRDVPQSIQVVNRALLDDRATFDFALAVTQNVSGATRSQYDLTGAGISSGLALRGFDLGYANNFMRDGIKFPNYGISEAGDVERIEVLKGPSSVLYGRAEPGGVVNLVTKKPLSAPFFDISLQAGQFGLVRPQGDVSGPIDAGATVRYRVNAVYERASTFRDDVDSRRVSVAPMLSWQPDGRTFLSVSGRYLHDRRGTDYGLLVRDGVLPDAVPTSRSYSEAASQTTAEGRRADVLLRRSLGGSWAIQSAYHYEHLGLDLPRQILPTFFEEPIGADGRTVSRMALPASFPEDWQYVDSSLQGQLQTGRISHDLLFGVEAGYQKVTSSYDFYLAAPATDLFDTTAPISEAQLDRFLASTAPDFLDRSTLKRRTVSGYAQDLVALTTQLKVLIGARFDDFDTTTTDRLTDTVARDPSRAVSPRLGLVYQPTEVVSLYGSYARSLGRTYPGRFTVNGGAFKAVRGEQYEAGLKLSQPSGRLSGTFALFQLTNDNLSAPDPNNPGFSIQSGQQRSRGLELDVSARPGRGLNLLATYSFMQPEVSAGDVFAIGNLLPNAARHNGNLWATYTVAGGALEGLGLGGGLQLVGERFTSLDNSILLPGFGRVDASAFYTVRRGSRVDLRLQMNLQNVLGRRYLESGTTFGTYVFPGAPRTLLVSAAVTRR
jgi:iron complex outermembrane receptor protein